MRSKLQIAVTSILAGTAFSLASTGSFAAGAVTAAADTTKWVGGNQILGADSSIQSNVLSMSNTAGGRAAWTGNPALNNSGWGHAVTWLSFDVTANNQNVTISDAVLSGSRALAFTVWASNGAFDGGTTDPSELSLSTNAPHSFNTVGQLGSAAGMNWASDPSVAASGGGNLLKTLAYVNGGNAHTSGNDWGEVINAGANQVDVSNAYFNSVTGSSTAGANGFSQLVFNNLAKGWYTIAVGGADNSLTGVASQQLTISSVSAVPLPGAVYLFGSALAGLVASTRRKRKLA
jgi:hypothetical protein